MIGGGDELCEYGLERRLDEECTGRNPLQLDSACVWMLRRRMSYLLKVQTRRRSADLGRGRVRTTWNTPTIARTSHSWWWKAVRGRCRHGPRSLRLDRLAVAGRLGPRGTLLCAAKRIGARYGPHKSRPARAAKHWAAGSGSCDQPHDGFSGSGRPSRRAGPEPAVRSRHGSAGRRRRPCQPGRRVSSPHSVCRGRRGRRRRSPW
jgi:hypothetical protein